MPAHSLIALLWDSRNFLGYLLGSLVPSFHPSTPHPDALHLFQKCNRAVNSNGSCLCSGWNKASLSLDASEEHDGYSSAEDPLNSDAEEDNGKTLVRKSRRDNWKPQPRQS